jgi:hypothetical protein
MQWFVQTPEYSFKNTASTQDVGGRLLWDLAALSIPLFMRSGAPPAHDVSKRGRATLGLSKTYIGS